MAATIKCKREQRQEIKEILLKELGEEVEYIGKDQDCISVKETNEGLTVEYPVGEIYGDAMDYVDDVKLIFKNLKYKFPNIEIWGIAYEYWTTSDVTYGPLFYCKTSDTHLTVTYDWQECAQCGKIIEGDTFYNSEEKDFTEGGRYCLCSPTCMLEYAFNPRWEMVGVNKSLSEKEQVEAWHAVDLHEAVRALLRNRIISSIENESYIKDFSAKKIQIQSMNESDNLDPYEKEVLKRILGLIEE